MRYCARSGPSQLGVMLVSVVFTKLNLETQNQQSTEVCKFHQTRFILKHCELWWDAKQYMYTNGIRDDIANGVASLSM